MGEFEQRGAKFILNDLRGMTRKFGKKIDFIPAKVVASMIRLEMSGELTRKETREICLKALRGS
jgi:hypothetical protein